MAETRERLKRGERRLQILQVLAQMLETPAGEKITTAALAARIDVSEAALYRHFASKAQMFEGLIEFIESSIFGVANKITADEENGLKQLYAMVNMLLGFAETNPGMTRVLIGDALVNENDRLQARINQLMDRIEATLKQCLRLAATQAVEAAQAAGGDTAKPPESAADPSPQANLILCYVIGRWHQFAKSGFKKKPTEGADKQLPLLLT
ncbi:MAG TPA: nucleoid occlusion factor SlmA [Burkholderiales bacterium]|nr:nucleoid occlusion factor SlmA [Burkholderiales bacterium]